MATTQRRSATAKDGMRTLNAFLIYRASDQSLRVVTKSPRLAWDEVAFTIQVRVPDPWGRLAGAIVVELPENGPAVVEVTTDATRP
jgi:hypothetical protein